MKIQKKIEMLLHYYSTTRKAGHSTLLKEGTKHYDKDFLVLAWHKSDYDFLEIKPQQVVSWDNLDILRGNNKPMVIDNGVLFEILGDVLMKIESLEEENEELVKEKRKIYLKRHE